MAGLDPLAFDEAAAIAAAEACRRTAALVDAAAEARHGAARRAQQEWRGPARRRFDDDLAVVQAEAADLAADLRRTAAAIERRVEAARADLRRRAGGG